MKSRWAAYTRNMRFLGHVEVEFQEDRERQRSQALRQAWRRYRMEGLKVYPCPCDGEERRKADGC